MSFEKVFDDPNTELFFRMATPDMKPQWVTHLEQRGIEVSPRAYLSQEQIDGINNGNG